MMGDMPILWMNLIGVVNCLKYSARFWSPLLGTISWVGNVVESDPELFHLKDWTLSDCMPSRDPLTSEFHSLNTGLLALSSCLDFILISNCSWSRVILICWGLAIVPAVPLMFNKTIFNHWEGKDNCKCFLPLDDVSISDSQILSSYKLIFDICVTESLDVLDVHDQLLDSHSADLRHLGDYAPPLHGPSCHWYNQQVIKKKYKSLGL